MAAGATGGTNLLFGPAIALDVAIFLAMVASDDLCNMHPSRYSRLLIIIDLGRVAHSDDMRMALEALPFHTVVRTGLPKGAPPTESTHSYRE